MNAAPLALYALGQIRQQEIDRKARTAWQYSTRDARGSGPIVRDAAVRLDAVAQGC